MEAIRRHCEEKLEVGFAVNNAFAKGGEGAVDLANLVVDTIENKPSEPLTFTYEESDCVERKIEKVACNLYGASVVTYSLHSRKVIKLIEQMGISITRLYRQDAVLLLCRPEDIRCSQQL